MAEKAKTCGMPLVPAGAFVAVVGAYEGAAVSNVAIGNDAEEVRAAQIDIQDGTQPIYVIATSFRGMVWQFTGATNRVMQVVAVTDAAQGFVRAGVVGIDKAKVLVRSAADCMRSFHDDREALNAKEALAALLNGRSPDAVVGKYQLSRVRFPVGQMSSDHPFANVMAAPTSEAAKSAHGEMLRFTPLGVAMFDPKAVVSAAPAKLYDVLPNQAGIVQLIEKGLLEVTGYSRSIDIGGTTIIGNATIVGMDERKLKVSKVASGFRIVGPMTFPAGLHGAHSATFTIAKGMPMPHGHPGHSSVTCETGKMGLKPGEICN